MVTTCKHALRTCLFVNTHTLIPSYISDVIVSRALCTTTKRFRIFLYWTHRRANELRKVTLISRLNREWWVMWQQSSYDLFSRVFRIARSRFPKSFLDLNRFVHNFFFFFPERCTGVPGIFTNGEAVTRRARHQRRIRWSYWGLVQVVIVLNTRSSVNRSCSYTWL